MYRALALKAIRRSVRLDAGDELSALARGTRIDLSAAGGVQRVTLDGEDVTAAIRTPEVSQAASRIAVIPDVRQVLVAEQRRAGAAGGVVMEGRDIGTKVFPHADVKIFLDADPVVREQRRMEQQKLKAEVAASVAAELRERDRRDRTRAASPLVAAADAVVIDSSSLGEDEVLARAEELVKEKLSD
jgi:cytidylate kinase